MAAVAHASPAALRRLVLVRTTPVVQPVRRVSLPTVYRRRRAVALMVVVTVCAALVLAMQGLFASLAGGTGTGVDHPSPAPAAVYVVQPGDTFWGIARQLDPGGDPRPLVARLVAAHGSPGLVAGERLVLPAAA